ncbi:MAG: VOC family protein [Chloroflexi bacterium]|nr:VOC family protein [Chloroflexota bacterium]
MNLVGLGFELFVTDLARSRRFYENVLGFTGGKERDGYLAVSSGAVIIGLGLYSGLVAGHHLRRTTQGPSGGSVEIVLEVDDVDAYYDRAQAVVAAEGGRIEPLQRRPWGARDFRIIDPDSYYLRITGRRVHN